MTSIKKHPSSIKKDMNTKEPMEIKPSQNLENSIKKSIDMPKFYKQQEPTISETLQQKQTQASPTKNKDTMSIKI